MTEALLVLAAVIVAFILFRVTRRRRPMEKKPDPLRALVAERTRIFETEAERTRVLHEEIRAAPGVILNLAEDGRDHLLGSNKKHGEFGRKYSLKREVRNWCRQYCTGAVTTIPHMDRSGVKAGLVHFAEENDAFMFKMRWY